MELDSKTVTTVIVALLLGTGGGGLGMDGWNKDAAAAKLKAAQLKYEAKLAADQRENDSRRIAIQQLLDNREDAHERAMVRAQEHYAASLAIVVSNVPRCKKK